MVDRCHVVRLDRYALDEKVAIARRHILPRIRRQFRIPEELVSFEDGREEDLLRFVIRGWTHEAGVRRLEQVLRTLFLRVHRREILEGTAERVVVSRGVVKRTLDEPIRPRQLNDEDRIGEILALGIDAERGVGSVIPIRATRIAGAADVDSTAVSMVHATGNIEKVMDESRRVATTGILHCAAELGVDPAAVRRPVHLHLMGGSSRKDGPSAGAAIALALASLLSDRLIRRDVAITGEVDPVDGGLAEVLSRGLPADGAVAVVAPYFALRDAIAQGRLQADGDTVLVATNWAVQGVKLKDSKGLVRRLWCRLLRLGLEHAGGAPFLVWRDGVWMLDLAPIPEKYRLDVRRAERILARGLERWLKVVEEGLASAGA